MFRSLIQHSKAWWTRCGKPGPIRKSTASLCVEILEDRTCPVTRLLWIGAENAVWSGNGVWQLLDGPTAGQATSLAAAQQADPTIRLVFTGAANSNSNSVDDVAGLLVDRLDVTSTYAKTITLQQGLTVNGGTFEAGGATITGAGDLTVNSNASFTWRRGVFAGTGKLIVSAAGTLNIDASVGDNTVGLNRQLQVNAGPLLGQVSFTSGTIQVGAGGSVYNQGTFIASSANNLYITAQAGAGSVETAGNTGVFAVSMAASAAELTIYTRFVNRNYLSVDSGTLTLVGPSENYKTINLGQGPTSGSLHYTLLVGATADVDHQWLSGTTVSGKGTIQLFSTYDTDNNRHDANLLIPTNVSVTIPETVVFDNYGGSIGGTAAGQGGTLVLTKTTQTPTQKFAGTRLWKGIHVEGTQSIVDISAYVQADGKVLSPGMFTGSTLTTDRGYIRFSGAQTFDMGSDTQILLKGAGWANPMGRSLGELILQGPADIAPLAGTTGAKIQTQDGGRIRKPDNTGDSTISVQTILSNSDELITPRVGTGSLRMRDAIFRPPQKGRQGQLDLRGGVQTADNSLTLPQGVTTAGMGTITVALSTNSGDLLPGDRGVGGVISFIGALTQTSTGRMFFDLGVGNPGEGYDQFEVTGQLSLAGQLNVDLLDGFNAATSTVLTLIDNQSSTATSGTFSGFAEGATFTVAGWQFRISYKGGSPIPNSSDGNDVTLTVLQRPSVWGRVFADTNGNGLDDPADASQGGRTVQLLDANGNTLSTTTTAGGGYYSFSGLSNGQYAVRVSPPSGWAVTLRDAGDDTIDSDVDSTGRSDTFTLDSTNPVIARDAGLYQNGSISGRAWEDANGNGIFDSGETVLGSRTARLLDATGTTVIATTTTATSDGSYSFTGVTPGSYLVEIVPGTGYALTTQYQGTDPTIDSDGDPATSRAPVPVSSGLVMANIDFGLYRPVQISGRVWVDTDADGVQDTGEVGLANALVTLYALDGRQVACVYTDSNGNYQFTGVAPGGYDLGFDQPSGQETAYDFTLQDQGSDSTDSDANANGITAFFTLLSGQQTALFDSGLVSR